MSRLGRITAAEIAKLRTLPSITVAAGGTVLVAAAVAAAIAASVRGAADVVEVVASVVPYARIGTIVVGVVAATSEYGRGTQIVTTLTACPRRLHLLVGKVSAVVVLTSGTSVLALSAACGAAVVAGAQSDITTTNAGRLVGAAVVVTLLGVMAFAVAVGIRNETASLAAMVCLVTVVSPLLAGRTGHARWLPDRAGALLYSSVPDAVLDPAGGTCVLLLWVVAALTVGGVRLVRDDAGP